MDRALAVATGREFGAALFAEACREQDFDSVPAIEDATAAFVALLLLEGFGAEQREELVAAYQEGFGMGLREQQFAMLAAVAGVSAEPAGRA